MKSKDGSPIFQPNKTRDISGERFGNLTGIRFLYRDNSYNHFWLFKCDCGNEVVLRKNSVTSGNTKWCAECASRRKSLACTTHGYTGTRLYRIWAGMVQRCCNQNQGYEWEKYGGRGISLCPEWRNSFENFRDWALEHGYDDSLSIDRIDVNGNYCPENCRWATVYEQNNNKRTSRYISFNGETGTVREFADKYGLAYSCLYARLKLGWGIKEALLTPSRKGKTA